jgi:lipoprotein-anchoring transpeptidase ErfK/SrfK
MSKPSHTPSHVLIAAVTGALALPGPAHGQKTSGDSQRSDPSVRRDGTEPERQEPANQRVLAEMATASIPDAVAWQAALDRAGFSPGIIDGIVGPKTQMGFRLLQFHAALPVTGQPDAATLAALGIDAQPAVHCYVLTEADAAAVGPSPQDWVAKSKAQRLGYKSLAALAAERGHCTTRLLAKLNPNVDLDQLKPGDVILLPNVAAPETLPQVARIEVDFVLKVVRAIDDAGGVVGLFHCSIAKDRADLPEGACQVKTIVMDPSYLFDPASWPEVEYVERRLVIPPGPGNPVGICWIGLSVRGYGIHGTPEPELIGKTGSHGCIRLTNWDVLRLAGMVHAGTKVRFVDSTTRVTSRSVEYAAETPGS